MKIFALALAFAATSPSILGTWELQSFTRITAEGKEIPWCKSPYGLLTYSPDGYMSASINCAKDTPADAPSQSYGNLLLYAGGYRVEDSKTVLHFVKNSSDLNLIGKTLPRSVQKLTGTDLVLTGDAANGKGRFVIEWKKAK